MKEMQTCLSWFFINYSLETEIWQRMVVINKCAHDSKARTVVSVVLGESTRERCFFYFQHSTWHNWSSLLMININEQVWTPGELLIATLTLWLLKVIQTFSRIWEEYWSLNKCLTELFGELNQPSGENLWCCTAVWARAEITYCSNAQIFFCQLFKSLKDLECRHIYFAPGCIQPTWKCHRRGWRSTS